MVQCTYCENKSVNACCKCQRPICSKHSHYKDHVFDNLYDANVAGHKYAYEVFCKDCDVSYISFDFLKVIVAFIFVMGLLATIASLVVSIW